MELIDCFKGRKSIRQFSDTPVPKDKIKILGESALYAPSAGALYPFTIIVLDNNPVLIFLCADTKKVKAKYGDRAERYIFMEAGHIAQNICLQAVELGLGAYCIGALNEEKARKITNHPNPVYLVVVGVKNEMGTDTPLV